MVCDLGRAETLALARSTSAGAAHDTRVLSCVRGSARPAGESIAAVDARTIRFVGRMTGDVGFASPFILATRRSTAVYASCSWGMCTVVMVGADYPTAAMSSKPTMERSFGTAPPLEYTACMAPSAMRSFVQSSADGRGEHSKSNPAAA